MKNTLILFLTILISNSLFCQSTEKVDSNTTAIRLIILNDKGEVLLKNSTVGWLTIDTYFKERQTIKEVIDSLSNRYGVSITKPNLKGVFTYKYDFKNIIKMYSNYPDSS